MQLSHRAVKTPVMRRFLATPLLLLGFMLLRLGVSISGMETEEELDAFFGLDTTAE